MLVKVVTRYAAVVNILWMILMQQGNDPLEP